MTAESEILAFVISATMSPAGVLSNYAITYNTASFTITAKAASVTPNVATKTYGAADPGFTGTLSGFLPADGVTATYSRTAGETVTLDAREITFADTRYHLTTEGDSIDQIARAAGQSVQRLLEFMESRQVVLHGLRTPTGRECLSHHV